MKALIIKRQVKSYKMRDLTVGKDVSVPVATLNFTTSKIDGRQRRFLDPLIISLHESEKPEVTVSLDVVIRDEQIKKILLHTSQITTLKSKDIEADVFIELLSFSGDIRDLNFAHIELSVSGQINLKP